MAQPTWVTEPGSLGTIPESRFYQVALEAFDPDFPADSTKVKYIKLSGDLPQGIQVDTTGIIAGIPTATVQGIPSLVSENITSKFAIRSFTEKIVNGEVVTDRINDRTFTMTVTGQDIPEFTTPAGLLGTFFDGQPVSIQIEFTDEDPDETVTVSLASGELPPGLTVDANGLISGPIAPATDTGSAIAGFEAEGWEEFPYHFSTGTISKTYEFTLKITDGTDSNLRKYSLFVGIITADSTAFTVDTDILTADAVSRAPFLNRYTPNLGTFLHDNYFSYQFNGVDFDGDILKYSVITSDTTLFTADSVITTDSSSGLPAGLVLDIETGFMHGTLTQIGLIEQTYSFTILVYKKDNPIIFTAFPFTMTVIGDINTGFVWKTDTNLGTIDNGSISELFVRADSTIPFCCYRMKPGSNSKLPQGLSLTIDGNIIGRVSYQTFGIINFRTTADSGQLSTSADTSLVTTDSSLITADASLISTEFVTVDTSLITADVQGFDTITFDNDTTTFDKTFSFTIEAFSTDMRVSTFRTFTITLVRKHDRPAHELRIDALPPLNDRAFLDALLFDPTVIKRDLLYRSDDPYFGIATDVSYIHAYGLNPETLSNYVESLEFNHYDRNLTLGEIRTAVALNSDGTIRYEVVYSAIIDTLTNNDNISVSQSVNSEVGKVFPNSLDNMRNRVIDKVGQVSTDLPRWMVSKQTDGNILGFTPAWVIAYTLPGHSSLVAYTINQNWEIPAIDGRHRRRLHRVDYTIDRYALSSQFTKNWDSVDQRWMPTACTTFDIFNHGVSADRNDITVDATHTFSSITSIDSIDITSDSTEVLADGLIVSLFTVDANTITIDANTITVDTTTQVTQSLTADLENPTTTETIFDGGSCRFIGVRNRSADIITETADTIEITTDGGLLDADTTFEVTDRFDEYLLFPGIDIINKKQVVTDII